MDLLSKVEGIEFVKPARPDECCGFGGTFSVFEEVVSSKMGYDKGAQRRICAFQASSRMVFGSPSSRGRKVSLTRAG
jgi:Fe-S oxidoreductase